MWQVTLCDPIRHVISHSSVVIFITNCYMLTFTFTFTYFPVLQNNAFSSSYTQIICHELGTDIFVAVQKQRMTFNLHICNELIIKQSRIAAAVDWKHMTTTEHSMTSNSDDLCPRDHVQLVSVNSKLKLITATTLYV